MGVVGRQHSAGVAQTDQFLREVTEFGTARIDSVDGERAQLLKAGRSEAHNAWIFILQSAQREPHDIFAIPQFFWGPLQALAVLREGKAYDLL